MRTQETVRYLQSHMVSRFMRSRAWHGTASEGYSTDPRTRQPNTRYFNSSKSFVSFCLLCLSLALLLLDRIALELSNGKKSTVSQYPPWPIPSMRWDARCQRSLLLRPHMACRCRHLSDELSCPYYARKCSVHAHVTEKLTPSNSTVFFVIHSRVQFVATTCCYDRCR